MTSENLQQCYNKGCGQKFDPSKNTEDSCTFHPGPPFFHDAYKGWSCCNKKCTDFTEFLNIKGCTRSFHNNVKPPEPEKPIVDKSKADEVVVYNAPKPVAPPVLERPSFDTPLVLMAPQVSPALERQVCSKVVTVNDEEVESSAGVPIGTPCQNHGCKKVYQGQDSSDTRCIFHPGQPVFHEGLKYWSCCKRRTTDFNTFLEQEGCTTGSHAWTKAQKSNNKKVKCRYDWHQTSNYVVVSIFAKKYDPKMSTVELNPIRLRIHLYFPEEDNAFDLDIELKGVVNVSRSSVSMMPTKCEIKLYKGGPGSWSKLHFPLPEDVEDDGSDTEVKMKQNTSTVDNVNVEGDEDLVDLSDL
ncbi:cysteine and histidine-rich domain-containing protein morgana [Schistocerca nitens]|uniref:cysteine and histidine-rich domain-containing protein morgana n=1 Tax=Schistocerca nitens TaxID=7011 RepID=UPI0021192925|nr:cysteine and histidine-rich domain-containing protein morgana [Schistocerca nitens]